jgi:SpoVK/Ycf46/Vps4 family AAA+-type ATPase
LIGQVSASDGGGVQERVLSTLLNELDGVQRTSGVLFVVSYHPESINPSK